MKRPIITLAAYCDLSDNDLIIYAFFCMGSRADEYKCCS